MKKSKEETDNEFLKRAEFLGEQQNIQKENNPNYIWCDICDKYYLADDVDWQNDTPICPNCDHKIKL